MRAGVLTSQRALSRHFHRRRSVRRFPLIQQCRSLSATSSPPRTAGDDNHLPFLQSSDADVLERRKVKVVLLENIHAEAARQMREEGFDVTEISHALSGDELAEVAADCHILGIRSKTMLDKEFFDNVGRRPHRLWALGCFCIGTNQVDLDAATACGVAVFNAPFSNTRSVAEKTLADIISLKRRLFQLSTDMHAGRWEKTAAGSHEVRGITLGIVGYGRIGTQVSVLAETEKSVGE